MIRAILFFLIIPSLSLAQLHPLVFYFEKDTPVLLNENVIKIYRDNIETIKSVGGKTTIVVPYEKTFKAGTKTVLIDGVLYQYDITAISKTVNMKPMRCKVMIFDFKKDEVKTANQANDNNDDLKAKDEKTLKEKIKKKDEEHEKYKKTKPSIGTPGLGKPK